MIIKLNAEYKKRLMESLRETVLLANNLKLEASEREFYSKINSMLMNQYSLGKMQRACTLHFLMRIRCMPWMCHFIIIANVLIR